MTAEPRHPALEQAIREHDDDGAFGVYGDWLAQQGHPRGMLATAQLARRDGVAAEVLARHPELWGGLDAYADLVTDVGWRGGWIDRARVANTFERYDGDKSPADVVEIIGMLVAGPGRFLRELVVGIVDFEGNTYDGVTRMLARHGPLPTLRSLYYGDFASDETELNWSAIGDLQPLYATAPNLEKLTLRSYRLELGAIVLPRLRELVIYTGGLGADAAAAIASATWPAIERLDVMVGRTRYGASGFAPLAPLFARTDLPALRHLGIKNFEWHAELLPVLLASPLLRQLEVLDLSLGTLADREVDALLAGRDRLAHLRELIVHENYLTPAGLARLRQLGIRVTASAQRELDDDATRYAAVYE